MQLKTPQRETRHILSNAAPKPKPSTTLTDPLRLPHPPSQDSNRPQPGLPTQQIPHTHAPPPIALRPRRTRRRRRRRPRAPARQPAPTPAIGVQHEQRGRRLMVVLLDGGGGGGAVAGGGLGLALRRGAGVGGRGRGRRGLALGAQGRRRELEGGLGACGGEGGAGEAWAREGGREGRVGGADLARGDGGAGVRRGVELRGCVGAGGEDRGGYGGVVGAVSAGAVLRGGDVVGVRHVFVLVLVLVVFVFHDRGSGAAVHGTRLPKRRYGRRLRVLRRTLGVHLFELVEAVLEIAHVFDGCGEDLQFVHVLACASGYHVFENSEFLIHFGTASALDQAVGCLSGDLAACCCRGPVALLALCAGCGII